MNICKLLLTLPMVFTLFCAGTIKPFYPGNYFVEDKTYQNKSLGFSLTFRGNWDIVTDPNEMKDNKVFAKELHDLGAELLFSGFTVEKTQGTRAIVTHLNETNREYADEIRTINKDQIDVDSGCGEIMINGKDFSTWRYQKNDFWFIEYFFSVDTYNIRVAFWTKPKLFDKFVPIYEQIMATLILPTTNK